MNILSWLKKETEQTFNYESQRFIIGLTAFFLPILVTLVYGKIISSISAYYYTISRNIFVGLLSITGLFLFVYNGKFYYEALVSKLAALCAVTTALSPTVLSNDITENRECLLKVINSAPNLHNIAAALLFVQLIFLCLCFARRAKLKEDKYSNHRRVIYLVCAALMTVSLITYPLLGLFSPFSFTELDRVHLLFYMESIALISFGVAWFTAGKPLQHWQAFRKA
ncbi:MAG: hypothetical protein PQJ60_00845 [Spirochaetales bacterium]|nr:hypothetical protein [Spirochaetales bacterium]